MKKILYILFLSMLSFTLTAQETQWMFGLNNVLSSNTKICSDNESNIIVANSFSNNGIFQFKNVSITTTSNADNTLLSKFTPDSSLIWLFSSDLATNVVINPIDITTEEVGNIYLLISYGAASLGNKTFSSNISLSYNRSGRRNAIIKFNNFK